MQTGKTRFIKTCLWILPLVLIAGNITGIIGPDKAFAAPAWYDSNWDYRKKITINSALVTADLADFPVLVSLASDADLAARALDNSYDILFTDSGGVKLDHEIESFNGATGQLAAWVRVPSVLDLTDTEIFLYYGNAAAADQQDAAGVWDADFKMVQHLEETAGAVGDSTQYSNDGTAGITPPGTQDAAGQIDGADYFDGNDQTALTNSSTILPSNANLTFSAWINLDSYNSNGTTTFVPNRVFSLLQDSQNSNLAFGVSHSGNVAGFTRNGSTATEFTGGSVGVGQWHFITLVKSGTTYQLYLDGTASGSSQTYAAPASQPSADPAYIGHDWGSGNRHFYGSIDEVRISDIARSADWIQTSYNNQNSPSTFITLGPEISSVAPAVGTTPATLVEETTATLNAVLYNDGGEPCQFSFEWGTASGVYTDNISWTGSITTGQAFSTNISGLAKGQTYYFRAKAMNSAGVTNGGEISFNTKPDGPVVLNAAAAGTTQINLTWTKGDGADNTLVRGKLGSYPDSISDGYQIYYGTETSVNMTGLTPDSTIYFRAWSHTSGVFSDTYASAIGTSDPIVLPSVTTDAATSVEETTATLNGLLDDDGGQNCGYSFEWGTASGVYTDNISWTGSITTGQTFSTDLVGLLKGQKYYYRAKSINGVGVTLGAEMEFLTKPDAPSGFTAIAISSTQIGLSWTLGDGAGRTMIRCKIGSYPVNYSDGDVVYFGPGTSYTDTGLYPDTTYFYAAWSEKTGSQQWSDSFASAFATTNTGPGPSPVGGRIFTINKAIVLAPWLAIIIVGSSLVAWLIVFIRKKYIARFSKHKKI